ncbi:MAG: metallophosphoesterase [Candidatus Micrarchaeaceae archaeon]
MRLSNGIELLDGMPIAFIRSIGALAIADLHLGYEGVLAKKGIFLPKMNLKHIMDSLDNALSATGAGSIVVDGDIKNEFSDVDTEEFNELYEFVNHFKEKGVKLILIKGNHDNFVDRYRESFGITIARQELLIGNYLFFHGEEMPKAYRDASTLIMGHEHPSIAVFTDAGSRERLRCFLYGFYKGKRLLVLPAMNYFAQGREINIEPRESMLSPLMRSIDIDAMHAIALGYGSTIDFGEIRSLRYGEAY